MDNLQEAYLSVYERYQGLYQSPQPTYTRSVSSDPKAMMPPGRRAIERSDELQRTEPGSKKEKSQTRKALQIQRHFQSARNVPEEVENWVNSLIEEGYDLSDYTWDEMYEFYLDEAMSSYDRNRQRAAQRAAARNAARKEGKTGNVPGVGYVSPRPEKETFRDSAGVERHTSGARMPKKDVKEDVDLFDYILEYLIAEGYADTNENAIAIMASMSEDWKEEILDEANRGEAHFNTPNWDKVWDRTQRDYAGPRGTSHQSTHRDRRPNGKMETGNQTTKRLSKERRQSHKDTRGVKQIKGGKGVQMQFGR